MALIVLSIIRCIDYLAYGTIFTRAMFLPKKKVMFFFPPEKPQMSPGRGVVRLQQLRIFGREAGENWARTF
jgi:hypothetical protein